MKNSVAPLACVDRSNHPLFTSRVKCVIDSNEVLMSVEKYIAKISPVRICVTRQNLSRDPMFHMYLILVGVGSSTKESLAIFATWLCFIV